MSDDAVARVVSVLQAFEDTDLVCGSESDPHGIRVGDLRTILARLAVTEEDARRMDTLQALLRGADFAYGEKADECVVLLTLPRGVRIGADFRAFADAARTAERGDA